MYKGSSLLFWIAIFCFSSISFFIAFSSENFLCIVDSYLTKPFSKAYSIPFSSITFRLLFVNFFEPSRSVKFKASLCAESSKISSPTFSPTSTLVKSIPSVVNFILLLLSSPNFFFTYSFAGLPKVSKPFSLFELSSATFLSCLPSKASFPCDISSVNVPNSSFISPILLTSIGINTFLFSLSTI